jgi:putative SOS response-associated peptidase YedK
MCNRYVSPEEAEIERFWHIGRHNSNPWIRRAEVFPRGPGPFIRAELGLDGEMQRVLAVGQWGLIPWFAKTSRLTYSTNNARAEEVASKASFKQSWQQGKRCIIPAWSFDEPCWETGRNVWWRFGRIDGTPWGLAGLWNAWTDKTTGEVLESYTMLTINADQHPLMSRMHKPDRNLAPDQQDKRSVIAIELADVDTWLCGAMGEVEALLRAPAMNVIDGRPGA